jgi:hypothetical protein
MLCASNVEREDGCCGDIFGKRMVWKPTSIEPSGGFHPIIPLPLRVIRKSDRLSQRRLGWDGKRDRYGDGALETKEPTIERIASVAPALIDGPGAENPFQARDRAALVALAEVVVARHFDNVGYVD